MGGLDLGGGCIVSVLFSSATLLSFAGFETTTFFASFVLGAEDGEAEGAGTAGTMPPDSDGNATRLTMNVLGALWYPLGPQEGEKRMSKMATK